MAKRYRPVRRDQRFLLPPDMADWLPEDHPVWLVITAVADHLDTSAFHAARRTGGAGAAGYDPDMLVTLLVWAYANGVTSSRRIEAACRADVAFAVICALDVPDHVTIARFRAAFAGPVQVLFTQVLVLCARLGMGQVGTVALDGTKIAANASKAANRTEKALAELAAAAVAAHAAADAAEDARLGEGQRGDRVPPGAAGGSRGERIAACLAELAAERQAAQDAQDAQARAWLERPRGGVPAGAAVAAAARRLERERAAQREKITLRERRDEAARAVGQRGYKGSRPAGVEEHVKVRRAAAALERAQAKAAARLRKKNARKGPGPVRNITDPSSRLMPTRGGFIQGYNPQNVASEDLLIIATELTASTTDTEWFEPMLRKAQDAAALIAAHRPAPKPAPGNAQPATKINLILADAGYLSEHNLTTDGPGRLIATGKNRGLRHTAANPRRCGGTANGPAVRAMAAKLATPAGITAYRQRGHIAETPHGHIKHNMRFRQLSLRGKPKATAEWTFVCTVHNLLKAITTGHLTRQTLATLTT
jgi:transposase